MEWWNAHVHEVPKDAEGKYAAVAGQQIFIADTRLEVEAIAKAAHPDDTFVFVHRISFDPTPRFYGFRWGHGQS